MDTLNKQFYKLNKNSEDIIYSFATEIITYRKQTDENGNLQIIEIRQVDGKKGKVFRIVPTYEMTIAEFDEWKKKLTDEAHEYFNKDSRETRYDVSIESLLETDLVSSESVEEEYLRCEEETQNISRNQLAMEIFDVLTPIQKQRYYQHEVLGMTVREIAEKENCNPNAVEESLQSAEKKMSKERKKHRIK